MAALRRARRPSLTPLESLACATAARLCPDNGDLPLSAIAHASGISEKTLAEIRERLTARRLWRWGHPPDDAAPAPPFARKEVNPVRNAELAERIARADALMRAKCGVLTLADFDDMEMPNVTRERERKKRKKYG